MTFPAHDDYWASTASFVEKHLQPGDRVVGPSEFTERIPQATAVHQQINEPVGSFRWVVAHKGLLHQFDLVFLRAAATDLRPVFSNEVFVVFSADKQLPAIKSGDVHLKAFNANLRELEGTGHRAAARVVTDFELQPYMRPVPDPLLRSDPRTGLNQICDISDWREGRFSEMLTELHESVRIHRKAWECAKCLVGLERLGAIRPDARALSVGAGAERPLFWLANHVDKMVATDIYLDQDGLWGWGSDFMQDPTKYAPFEFRREGLEVLDMSGLELKFPDDHFDIVYTLSSIEHFGGHEAAAQSMREIARVTKPGGIVCIVSELLLSTQTAPDFFTLPEVRKFLIESHGMQLVEPEIDLRISESLLAYPSNMRRDPPDTSPHIVVTGWGDTRATWTSIILFFRK